MKMNSNWFRSLLPALTLFVAPAWLVHVAPMAVGDALVFKRDAIAVGEWWRLATGHWVHFGATHLVLNGLTLLGAGMWLERLRAGELVRFTAVAAPLLGGMLWLLEPAMGTYGGLSGLACGVVTLAALTQMRAARDPFTRIWCAALLVVVGMKALVDVSTVSRSLMHFTPADAVRVSQWAHLAGAVVGVGFFLSRRRGNSLPVASVGASAA